MSDLTPAEFQKHFETDLEPTAIQTLIDDAELAVSEAIGARTGQVDDLSGGDALLFLRKRFGTVTSVVETVGTTETTLAADDYVSRNDGWILERKNDGTNARSCWGNHVRVTYAPATEAAARKRATIDLVKLSIQFDGLAEVSDGNHRQTSYENYNAARQSVLDSVRGRSRAWA